MLMGPAGQAPEPRSKLMFLKDTYSHRRLQNLFHEQVLGVVEFEDLHGSVREAIKKARVIDAAFSISYEIQQIDGKGRMTYRISLSGTKGIFFKRKASAFVQFESPCEFEHPVHVEAKTEINDKRHEVTTTYQTYIGQGRGVRLIRDTDHLV
jgi:hypothetical protein